MHVKARLASLFTLSILALVSGSTSYATETPTSPNPTLIAHQAVSNIEGVYRLVSNKRTLLAAKQDPLAGIYAIKGKLVIERLTETTFLVFDAETIKNTGTLHYVKIFEAINETFLERLAYVESSYVANIQINASPDQLVIKHTERDQFEEITIWKRIDPINEVKDKYLEKHLVKAEQDFNTYALAKYQALRAQAMH